MTTPDTPAAPAPLSPVPSGPVCGACGEPAVVNWQRRPTGPELADIVTAEKDRRAEQRLLADHRLPPPEFGPLPGASGITRAVYACATHAITLEAAALIHDKSCTAPNPADLPGCNCTPETPTPAPAPAEQPVRHLELPAHWTPAGA